MSSSKTWDLVFSDRSSITPCATFHDWKKHFLHITPPQLDTHNTSAQISAKS